MSVLINFIRIYFEIVFTLVTSIRVFYEI